MKEIKDNFGFYSILTNPIKGYEYTANVLAELSVPFVQLRIKDESEYKILKIAEKLTKIFEQTETSFIINDSLDIALDSGADGIHVGQDDISPAEIRERAGDRLIVGLSTHNLEQTKLAQSEPINYIGVGPVYPTPTKQIPDPVLGLSTMREMVELSKVPAVCIGGISTDRLLDILENGAKNFCMVREICQSDDPKKSVQAITSIYNNFIQK